MTTLAEVKLWGTTIGAVALGENDQVASFEYESSFLRSGIEVSPIMMPLSQQVYSFPVLPLESFHGLPGMLADGLPDRFGNALIDTYLSTQGRAPGSFNAIERLCYTGTRGMGALEYHPASGPTLQAGDTLQVAQLVQLASRILSDRGAMNLSLDAGENAVLNQILQVGTSAGGARAKAVIAWNPATNEVRSGQVDAGQGFEYWLLKFDGVTGNRDKELQDPRGYGAIEYAYHHMALAAGIEMSPCRLFEENGRRHFMTRRFDRLASGDKLHMQSLGALAHYDFNQAGAYGYEQVFWLIRQLALPVGSSEEQFRRMVFNIVARNQDDHVKNIAFLMNRSGAWSLAPAYDLTYSYQPSGNWTSSHQMTLNGKRDNFVPEDFVACGKSALLKRGRAKKILGEVSDVVARWRDFADEAGVLGTYRDKIWENFRLGMIS